LALPATAFVNFLQNHDQIGNRALGERLTMLAAADAVEAALAVMLLSPSPPLLFMGEEWGTRMPFPFFCDFKGDLAEAVRSGRRKEFAEAYAQHHDEVPDPLSEQTVRKATLDWTERDQPEHRARLDLVRRLLAARKQIVIPRLPEIRPGHGRAELIDDVLSAMWFFRTGETQSVLANLGQQTRPRPYSFRGDKPVWGGAPPQQLPPWSVYATIGT
jgi:1,4-alpha-glucan branching enzyme